MDDTLFQKVFESSIEGILVVNATGKIIKANAAAENIFGYKIVELEQLKIEDLIPQKHRKIHKVHNENYAKQPTSRHSEKLNNLIGLQKNGTEFAVAISLSPTIVNHKKLTIAFIRDVTKRREASKALLESERKLNTVIGNLPGFVYRCKNDKNYTAEYGSEGVYKITGYKISHFITSKINFGQIILEKDREYVWNTIQKALSEKKTYSLEYRIITKTGEIKYLWGQGEGVYDAHNNVLALEGFVQDISDTILLEKIVKQKEAKSKALLQALPDMMFIMDSKGKILDFHAPDSQKLSTTNDNLMVKNMNGTFPPEAYNKIVEAAKTTINEQQNTTIEYHLKRNKKNYYYEARIVPLDEHKVLTIVRDVTVKKQTENTLQIRNRALGAAGNGILIVDAQQPDFPIIYANKTFTKITGYKHSDVLGKNCRFLQNDDRDQDDITIMSKAIKTGKMCQVILRNYKKDGTLFYNELTITPVYNNAQELTHFIGVNNDVTERKTEELLKEQMSHVLKMIAQEKPLEHIAEKIIKILELNIIDSTGVILSTHQKSQILQKVSAPNLPKSFKILTQDILILSEECPCATAALTGKKIIIENLMDAIKWKNYKILAMKEGFKSSWSFPVFSSAHKVIGVFTLYGKQVKKPSNAEVGLIASIVSLLSIAIEQESVRQELYNSRKKLAAYAQELEEKVQERTNDLKAAVQKLVDTNLNLEDQIIETKSAERKALDNQALFSAIAKNFPKGAIAVVNSDNKLIFIDGDELSNIGFSKQHLKNIAIDAIDLMNNDQKNFLKESIRRTLSGKHLSIEINFRGQTYSLNTTPFYDTDHKINRALLVFNNISKHKQVELDILNALRKEQELNELKSSFVSMASHEFRTPLSTILSSATLIERQNEVGNIEKRLNYISKIKSNVRNLVNILNDFLSLSKLEEGKLTFEVETFDLISFSKNIIEEIEMNKKEGQTFEFKYDRDQLEINQDPKIIRLIFNNLLSNAIKYSPENKAIKIRITTDNDKVYLECKDEGIGIPPEDQEQLFQRFFRSKNASHIQGTGLGLYILKQYINLMGGTIHLKNNEHEGTTFFVEFPIKNE